jgi:23S rRNA (cytidine1920-2'-O)/16S rRNA (cytidine1409-2'-O)-methyltransferase
MKSKATRKRLDVLLVERGLAESVQKAQGMILAGEIRVAGARSDKAGMSVSEDLRIEVSSRQGKYASRGGVKLEGALEDFGVDPTGRVCLDVGASTGGFTDCLLQHGAAKVYAMDVNVAQMDWKLQGDARVVRIERNARELHPEDLGEEAALVVADVSFISVGKILAPAAAVASAKADFLILIKPQFELRRAEVGPGGIVADKELHDKAIAVVQKSAEMAGLQCLGVRASRLTGAEGNQEFFLHARKKTPE